MGALYFAIGGLVLVACTQPEATPTASATAPLAPESPRDEVVFGGEGTQLMNSLTAGGPGLVAVGIWGLGNDGDGAV